MAGGMDGSEKSGWEPTGSGLPTMPLGLKADASEASRSVCADRPVSSFEIHPDKAMNASIGAWRAEAH
jgi:hypothetical protein